ncbi:MAG TPA: hypothetical protein VFP93_03500, partial [Gammaproteobacteria bacterium]|nr:hypothetical protein [Gammaproteobacteria bacterium]
QLLSLDLLNLNDELVELCWNISLENADIQILKAFHDYYVKSTTPAFQYFLKNGLTKKNYDKFLLLDRDNAGENIPEITIEGAEIKHPGFYLKKVCAKNDQEAARAACLGKLTDCCQSLSGEAGEPCVIHGLTNPDGGFYVLCQGDSENPSISDDVIGQCWVWRSKNGALVFDSIEMPKDKLMMYKNIVVDFYQSLGKKLVQEGYTHKVNCGKNSGISADVGFATLEYNKEEFIDYQGYCDSRVQFSIFDEDFPYPHYVKDSVITQKIDEDLEKAMRSNMPLVQVKEFANALNWAFVEKYNRNMNTNADAIIDKIQELSIQYNKQE